MVVVSLIYDEIVAYLQDGKISYEEFSNMMKAGTDWRKASRQYSRERFNTLSRKLQQDNAVQVAA